MYFYIVVRMHLYIVAYMYLYIALYIYLSIYKYFHTVHVCLQFQGDSPGESRLWEHLLQQDKDHSCKCCPTNWVISCTPSAWQNSSVEELSEVLMEMFSEGRLELEFSTPELPCPAPDHCRLWSLLQPPWLQTVLDPLSAGQWENDCQSVPGTQNRLLPIIPQFSLSSNESLLLENCSKGFSGTAHFSRTLKSQGKSVSFLSSFNFKWIISSF